MWRLRDRVLELFSSSRSMRGLSVLGGVVDLYHEFLVLAITLNTVMAFIGEDLDNSADSKKAPSNKIYE